MIQRIFAALLLLLACGAARAAAQEDPVLRPDTVPVADTIPRELPSPRAAFARAMLVPGWGHVYAGEYRRGAVYGTLQVTSWAMLIKTLRKLDEVRDRDERLTRSAADSLAAAMAADTALARQLQNPEAYEAALLTYPGLANARGLARARREQRQDWVTYTLFFTFAAAVDAYVTTHLKDFPGEVRTLPTIDGGMSLSLSVPVGGRR